MFYSQKDPQWAKNKLGNSNLTFAADACYLTSICNLGNLLGVYDKDPISLNHLFIQEGAFQGANIISSVAAKALGMTYLKAQLLGKSEYVICETNYYARFGAPQHFFVLDVKNSKVLDPLVYPCVWMVNKYPIVSYRVFTPIVISPEITFKEADNVPAIKNADISGTTPQTIPTYQPEELNAPSPVETRQDATWIDSVRPPETTPKREKEPESLIELIIEDLKLIWKYLIK